MTDEERRVLHKDLDRIIDSGGDPVVVARSKLNAIQETVAAVRQFSLTLKEIGRKHSSV